MELTLLKNDKKRKERTVELFGLTRSGKTTFLKKLIMQGKEGMILYNIAFSKKLISFLSYLFTHASNTLYLFYKLNTNWINLEELSAKNYFQVFLMRNSYLGAVLSKYNILKGKNSEFFVDEYLIQSIFMIFHKRSSEKELLEVLKRFPPSGKILIIESSVNDRYDRIKNTRFPGEQIHRNYSVAWMKNSEFNYKIIKNILIRNYGPVEKNPEL